MSTPFCISNIFLISLTIFMSIHFHFQICSLHYIFIFFYLHILPVYILQNYPIQYCYFSWQYFSSYLIVFTFNFYYFSSFSFLYQPLFIFTSFIFLSIIILILAFIFRSIHFLCPVPSFIELYPFLCLFTILSPSPFLPSHIYFFVFTTYSHLTYLYASMYSTWA
jgi:hypothetical protein